MKGITIVFVAAHDGEPKGFLVQDDDGNTLASYSMKQVAMLVVDDFCATAELSVAAVQFPEELN